MERIFRESSMVIKAASFRQFASEGAMAIPVEAIQGNDIRTRRKSLE